jgi:hypothetical protein
VADGIPDTPFAVGDVQAEFDRLTGPRRHLHAAADTPMGPVTTAVFDDTCGNLIQIAEMR